MADTETSGGPGPWLGYVVAGVGMLVLLALGPFYLSSGLVAPLWAVLVLLAFWVLLVVLGVRWFRRRPFVVLALPVVAAVVWFLAITAGERLLGWTG